MASLEEIKQEIKMRVDLVDLVRARVELKRAGRDWKGLSPFTKEKTPSFVVHPHEQFYKCFSSGEAGDIFTFVMKTEGVEFMTALKMLARRAGISLEERWDQESGNKSGVKKERLHDLMRQLSASYRELFLNDERAVDARKYAESRDLMGETGEIFGLGYAPDAFDFIAGWASEYGFREHELRTAGVVSWKDEKPDHWYDRFRDRLMFPIRDEMGRVIGFSGRVMKKEAKGGKYVNSPETPLFKKSRVLFGLDLARKPMVDVRRAMVCEGQIDVMRCHQFGFDTAVASQGTALTEDHARILKRYVDEVVLVMDSDKAGVKAALRSGEIFLEKQLSVRVVRLPEGDDPDTILLGAGKERFEELVSGANPFVDFQVDVLLAEHDPKSDRGLAAITQGVLQTVVRAPSEVVKDGMLRRVAERLDLSVESLRKDLDRMVRPKFQEEKRRKAARESATGPAMPTMEMVPRERPPLEMAIVELAMVSEAARSVAKLHVAEGDFSDETLWSMFSVLSQLEGELDEEALNRVRELGEEAETLVEEMTRLARSLTSDLGGGAEAAQMTIIRLRQLNLKRQRSQVERRLLHVDEETRQMLHLKSNQLTDVIARLRQNERNWSSAVELLQIYN